MLAVHVSIAKARGEAHWLLDPDEAKALSAAFKDASGHYLPAASQKAVDTAIFVGTVAMIYGSRVLTSVNMANNPPPPAQAYQPADQPVANGAAGELHTLDVAPWTAPDAPQH